MSGNSSRIPNDSIPNDNKYATKNIENSDAKSTQEYTKINPVASNALTADPENFPGIKQKFSEVTSQTLELTKRNIKGLRANEGLRAKNSNNFYFLNRIKQLPWAYIKDELTFTSQFRKISDKPTYSIDPIKFIAGGTYGKVFQGKSGKAYKKMTMKPYNDDTENRRPPELKINEYKEKYYREIYLEAFIQTVLQNDPMYGSNIARIDKMYKNYHDEFDIYYYEMERINSQNGIAGYLESQKVDGSVPLGTIVDILKQLATILAHFKTEYKFFHRDLHCGNVLFHEFEAEKLPANLKLPLLPGNRQIKIIDFGLSCMTSKLDKVFSVNTPACSSYDLLVYLTYLLQVYPMYFNEITVSALKNLYKLSSEENLYTEFIKFKNRKPEEERGTIYFFHFLYFHMGLGEEFWRQTPDGTNMRTKFQPVLDNFQPENFLTILDEKFPPVGSSGGKYKKSRKSRKNRKSRKSRSRKN